MNWDDMGKTRGEYAMGKVNAWWLARSTWQKVLMGLVVLGAVTIVFATRGDRATPANSDTAATAASSLASNERHISASDYGDRWPLTVEDGILRCEGARAVVFIAGGRAYGVNGTALTMGYPEIDPIWAVGEYAPRKDIGPLIGDGLALCG